MNDLAFEIVFNPEIEEAEAENAANSIQYLIEEMDIDAPAFFENLAMAHKKLEKLENGEKMLAHVLNEIARGKINWIALIVKINNSPSIKQTLSFLTGIKFD